MAWCDDWGKARLYLTAGQTVPALAPVCSGAVERKVVLDWCSARLKDRGPLFLCSSPGPQKHTQRGSEGGWRWKRRVWARERAKEGSPSPSPWSSSYPNAPHVEGVFIRSHIILSYWKNFKGSPLKKAHSSFLPGTRVQTYVPLCLMKHSPSEHGPISNAKQTWFHSDFH